MCSTPISFLSLCLTFWGIQKQQLNKRTTRLLGSSKKKQSHNIHIVYFKLLTSKGAPISANWQLIWFLFQPIQRLSPYLDYAPPAVLVGLFASSPLHTMFNPYQSIMYHCPPTCHHASLFSSILSFLSLASLSSTLLGQTNYVWTPSTPAYCILPPPHRKLTSSSAIARTKAPTLVHPYCCFIPGNSWPFSTSWIGPLRCTSSYLLAPMAMKYLDCRNAFIPCCWTANDFRQDI